MKLGRFTSSYRHPVRHSILAQLSSRNESAICAQQRKRQHRRRNREMTDGVQRRSRAPSSGRIITVSGVSADQHQGGVEVRE
jgi:hypothetical protein